MGPNRATCSEFLSSGQRERRELIDVIHTLREETSVLKKYILNLEDSLSSKIAGKPLEANIVANDNSIVMTNEEKINIQLAEVRHNLKIKYHNNKRNLESNTDYESNQCQPQSEHTEETIPKCPLNVEATTVECPSPNESHSMLKATVKENAPKLPQTDKSHHWPRGTTLVVGDSMLGGVQERLIGPRGNIKVRSFPGASSNDMKDYIRPLLRKCPDRIVLHVGTNDAIQSSPEEIVQNILSVKLFIEHELKSCDIIVSSPIDRLTKMADVPTKS